MVNVGALKTTISLDSAQFEQGMAGVNRQLKSLKQEQKAVTSSGTGFARGLTEMRSKADVLSRTFDVQQAKVRELRRRYEESRSATGEHSKATQEASEAYNRAVAEMNRTEDQLKNLNAEIKRQESPWTQLSEKMTSTGERLQDIGRKTTDFGKSWSMRVTAPIVGLGVAALNAGIEFEASMSKVQALTGATGDEMEAMTAQAKELGETTRFSASEAAEGMAFLGMAGWDTQAILDGMPGLLSLAASANMELGRAADITSNIMAAFNIEAAEAGRVSDILAHAASNSNTNVEQLGEAMKYVAPTASTLGISIEDTAAAVMAVSDAGIQGSMAGRAFGTSLLRLSNPTKAMQKEMEKLNISFFDSEGAMKPLPEIIGDLESATADYTSEQTSASLSTLFGAEAQRHWAILLDKGSEALGENSKALEESEGAAKRMADTMMDNAKGGIVEFKSALEGAGITIAEHLLPTFTDLIEKGTDLVRKFGELDRDTQKTIITIAGLAAAVGPAAIVLGNMTTAIGGILKVGGSLAGVLGKAGAGAGTGGLIGGFGTLGASAGPVALATLAIAGLTAAGIALHKHMKEDVIPEVDLFGDTVSESTQKAVGAYMDLNNEASVQLTEMSITGREVSEEMAESLTGTFEQMGTQIVEGLEQRKEESLAAIEDLFMQSETISEEGHAQLLDDVVTSYNERVQATEEGQARIKEILQLASEENRSLTKAEQEEINRIQEEMKNNAIVTLTANEQEQRIIFERMSDQADTITKRQMADVIKNSIEMKDKTIEEAENQYYLQKQTFEKMRDETGELSAEQADELIREAERQKDETVRNAEEMHQSVLDEAKKQNPNLIREVDMATGEILSRWESLAVDAGLAFAEIYPKARDVWNDVKTTFAEKIAIAAPTMGSAANLLRNAETIWTSVRNIFQRKISMPAPTMRNTGATARSAPQPNRRTGGALGARYADGTPPGGHKGGQFLAGEEGWELGRMGNRWEMLNFGLYDRPRGYEVFTHDESKKIVRALNNIPGYAGGASPPGEVDRVVNGLNTNNNNNNVQGITVLNEAILQQNKLLQGLLNKENDVIKAIKGAKSIIINGKEIVKQTIDEHDRQGANQMKDYERGLA